MGTFMSLLFVFFLAASSLGPWLLEAIRTDEGESRYDLKTLERIVVSLSERVSNQDALITQGLREREQLWRKIKELELDRQPSTSGHCQCVKEKNVKDAISNEAPYSAGKSLNLTPIMDTGLKHDIAKGRAHSDHAEIDAKPQDKTWKPTAGNKQKTSIMVEDVDIAKKAAVFGSLNRRDQKRLLVNPGNNVTRGVAFSAYLSHPTHKLGTNQIITFDSVLFNDGNGYHPNTGVFTAPKTGVYLFFFSVAIQANTGVYPNDDGEFWAQLLVNGKHQVDAATEVRDSGEDSQGSNLVLVSLQAGDDVYVAELRGIGHDLEGYSNKRVTSFSGVLLYS